MEHRRNIIFLFSGQGSQYRGMGKELFECNQVFRQALLYFSDVVSQLNGVDITKAILEDQVGDFKELRITHPSILVIELAILKMLRENGVTPDIIVGESLGDFAAATAAGVWREEHALTTCVRQANVIETHVRKGGMTMVLTQRDSFINQILFETGLDVASENFPGCFTVSGLLPELTAFEAQLKKRSLTFQRLPVMYPFHSGLLEVARKPFLDVGITNLNIPRCRMYSVSQQIHLIGEVQFSYFWEAVTQPNNVIDTIKQIEEVEGASFYIDLGPSGGFATAVKYNLNRVSRSKCFPLLAPFKGSASRLESLYSELLFNHI